MAGYKRALRRLADNLDEKPAKSYRFERGTIDHVTAAAARDGHAAAFVAIGADIIPAPYLASYTPVAGHMVDVRFDDGSPLILGQIIGLPNF